MALALAALAQSGKGTPNTPMGAFSQLMSLIWLDVSVERVAALAQENALPEPALDLASLPTSNSTFQDIMQMPPQMATRGYSTEDPWASKFTTPSAPSKPSPAFGNQTNGAPSNINGTGLPRDWWKKQENVFVNVLGQQGFILNRYLVYEISSDVRGLTRVRTTTILIPIYSEAPLFHAATQNLFSCGIY